MVLGANEGLPSGLVLNLGGAAAVAVLAEGASPPHRAAARAPPPAALWAGVGLIAAAAGAVTVPWIRRMDEVEVADLLWSSFLGLQVFAIGAPCWELLAAAEAAPPVNRYVVYFTTTAVSLATYLWRRFRRG